MHFALGVGFHMVDDLMSIIRRKPKIRLQGIGENFRPQLNVLSDFRLHGCPSNVFYMLDPDLALPLQQPHDGGLANWPGSGDSLLTLALVHVPSKSADESFVRLNF